MNLSWHIAKKDIRRFWVPLLILSVVTALRLIVGYCLLKSDGSDPGWFGRMAVYANVLWGIGLFLTYMLVGSVVHEDSVSKEAFWQTRPISGASLLAGKTLGLFLMFGLLPLVLLVPWWLGCGFGWPEIWRAVAETLVIQLGVVLLALPWSVVTRDDGRFLLWTVVVAVAFATASMVLAGQSVVRPDLTPWFGASLLATIIFLAALGSACVTIYQFMTRRTVASVVIIVATAFLMVSAPHWERWDGSRLWLPRFGESTGLAMDVTLSFESSEEWLSKDGYGWGQVDLLARHVPPHYSLAPTFSEQSLRWADGRVTDNQARYWSWWIPWYGMNANDLLGIKPDPVNQGWARYSERRYLVRRRPPNSNDAGKMSVSFMTIFAPETVIRLVGEKPSYEGDFWFRLLKTEVVGERDLQSGSEFPAGARYSRIALVEKDRANQDLLVTFIEQSPLFLWTDLLEQMNLAPSQIRPAYLIVNRTRTDTSVGDNQMQIRALIGSVAIVLRKDGFRIRNVWNGSKRKWEKETGGFDGSTLAEVNYREVERFSLPIRKEGFSTRFSPRIPTTPNSLITISVSGEVSKTGDFGFEPGSTVITALQRAGGVSERADLKRVELRRAGADGSTSTVIVNVDSWLNGDLPFTGSIPMLQPSDVIYVPAMDDGRSQ